MPGEDRAQGENRGEVGRSGCGTTIALEWTGTAHRQRIGGLVLVSQTPLVCKGFLSVFILSSISPVHYIFLSYSPNYNIINPLN